MTNPHKSDFLAALEAAVAAKHDKTGDDYFVAVTKASCFLKKTQDAANHAAQAA